MWRKKRLQALKAKLDALVVPPYNDSASRVEAQKIVRELRHAQAVLEQEAVHKEATRTLSARIDDATATHTAAATIAGSSAAAQLHSRAVRQRIPLGYENETTAGFADIFAKEIDEIAKAIGKIYSRP